MGIGQWAMGNGKVKETITNSQFPIPNTEYFSFPAGRYATR
jgi:hypothetical protein